MRQCSTELRLGAGPNPFGPTLLRIISYAYLFFITKVKSVSEGEGCCYSIYGDRALFSTTSGPRFLRRFPCIV